MDGIGEAIDNAVKLALGTIGCLALLVLVLAGLLIWRW